MEELILLPRYLLYFPIFWYGKMFHWFIIFIWRSLALIADGLAIGPMFGALFKPFREDRTWVGRGIGFLVRFVWLVFSGALFLLSLLILLLAFVTWLAWPILGLVFFFRGDFDLMGIIFSLCFIVYLFSHILAPKAGLNQVNIEKVNLAMDFSTRRFFLGLTKASYSSALAINKLASAKQMRRVWQRLNLSSQEIIMGLEEKRTTLEPSWQQILNLALKLGNQFLFTFFDIKLIFLAWARLDSRVEETFRALGLAWEDLVNTVFWVRAEEQAAEHWKYWRDEYFHLRGGVDRAWVAGFLPHLKLFSTDVTKLVGTGRTPRVIGRHDEIEAVVRILSRTTQNNALLVGSAGVGKSTIVYGIAERILSGEIGESLRGKKLIRLDLSGLFASSLEEGDLEQKIRYALMETRSGKMVLLIEDIQALVGSGDKAVNVLTLLAPYLQGGEIQVIGTATPENFRKFLEHDPNFTTLFGVVRIEEPTDGEAIRILEGISANIEHRQKVNFTYQALEAAVKLTRRFVHDQVLPDKAVDLIDETAVWKKDQPRSKDRVVVTEDDIRHVLASKIKIPVEKLQEEESERLLHLEEVLHQRIIDQEEAVQAVSNALRRARAGLAPKGRPLASFLFVGPTGVGKTETAKALCFAYFGSHEEMVRLDMSEYGQAQDTPRAIEQLATAVRESPYTLLLLDEFEKAHPDVYNLLLQVLEDGRLTDLSGRTVDFTNTLIIGTSNVYSRFVEESIVKGIKIEKIKEVLLDNLSKIFRPELLNRFDGVIVFKPLTVEEVVQIAKLLLAEVEKKLTEQGIKVKFTSNVAQKVAELGYDPTLGARPLRRVIQDKVENVLAEKILRKQIKPGASLTIDLVHLGLHLTV